MKLYLFRIIFLITLKKTLSFELPRNDDNCKSDLTINNERYNVSKTYNVSDSSAYPTDAHYDKYGNLFFVETGRTKHGYYFDVKMIDYKGTDPQKINGLPEGISYSIAVDNKDTKVYFGTGHGMYSYDYESGSANLISEKNMKLDMIFVDKDGNKYVTESNNGVEELFLLDGSKKIRFHALEALNELAIDKNNNFYYIKEEMLYVLKSTLSSPVCIGNVIYDGMAQISFHKERVFVASDDLVYFHENDIGILKTVNNVPGKVTAVAFDDSGDFVLGVQGKLLKYKKNECYFRDSKPLQD